MENKFKTRYSITSDILKPNDVKLLMNKMGITSIPPEKLNEIYKELDINKDGVVTISEFVETVLSKNGDDEIFGKLLEGTASKAEVITYKLKKLKNVATFAKDEQSVKDIEWILSNLASDIFEPENYLLTKKNRNCVDTMLSYTNALTIRNRNEDCKLVKEKSSKRNENTLEKRNKGSFLFRTPSKAINFTDAKEAKEGVYSPEEEKFISSSLSQIDSPTFDIFELEKITKKHTLHFILNRILEMNEAYGDIIDYDKYLKFINAISIGYDRNVLYHNDIHAADVLQTAYTIMTSCDIKTLMKLSIHDVVALCVACSCHDFKHNGFTNLFHQNDMTILSITYNDQSILENFHVAETFKIIHNDEYNLFCNLSKEEFRHIRRRMINCILSTDMAFHSKMMADFKNKISIFNIENGKNSNLLLGEDENKYYDNQQSVLNLVIHSSDISNPTKIEKVYDKWVELVMNEFFLQGDLEKEKNLPISPLCNRETTSIPSSQLGFMNFVVLPSFKTFHIIFPQVEPYLNQLKKNCERYAKLVENESNKK